MPANCAQSNTTLVSVKTTGPSACIDSRTGHRLAVLTSSLSKMDSIVHVRSAAKRALLWPRLLVNSSIVSLLATSSKRSKLTVVLYMVPTVRTIVRYHCQTVL